MAMLLGAALGLGLLVSCPGLVLARAARLGTVASLCLAPSLGVPVVLAAGVAARWAGVAWTLPAGLLCVALVTAALAVGLRRLTRTDQPGPGRAKTTTLEWVGLSLGWLASGVSSLVAMAPVLTNAAGVAQQPDTLFHLSATRWMSDHHSGSMFDVTAWQGSSSSYYPGAFQALAATVSGWGHVEPAVAAHAVVLFVLVIVWPLASMSLVSLFHGQVNRGPWLGALGLTSTWFVAFPYLFLGVGVLWSNHLAFALVPAALTLVGSALGRPMPSATLTDVRTSSTLLALVVLAIGSAQPNGVFTLVLLAYPLTALALLARARPHGLRATRLAALTIVLGAMIGLLLVVVAAPRSLVEDGPDRSADSMRAGLFVMAKLGESDKFVAVLPAILVIVGVLAAVRRRELSWMIVGLAASGGLFLAADLAPGTDSRYLTWPWWTDWVRLLAMAAMVASWCAAWGLVFLWDRARGLVGRWGTVMASATAVLAVAASAITSASHDAGIAATYHPSKASLWWVTPSELEALGQLAESIPADARVAADPYRGGSYLAVVHGTHILFPSTLVTLGGDSRLIAGHLDDLTTSTAVCAAADRLDLSYVLTGGDVQESAPQPDVFAGLAGVESDPDFAVVARAGPYELHALPPCATR